MADAIVSQFPIITRVEARSLGMKRYFTGLSCPLGHFEQRLVSSGSCMACDRIRSADRRKNHPDRVKESSRATYLANRERWIERSKKWKADNPEAAKALKSNARRNRRARQRNSGGVHTRQQIDELMRLQRYKCACCSTSIRKSFHADHIMPLALGGHNGITNIQLLCPPCNGRKSAKHPVDFARENGMLL